MCIRYIASKNNLGRNRAHVILLATDIVTRVLLNTYPCADSSLMHVEIAFEEVRFETLFIFTGWSHCSYFPVKNDYHFKAPRKNYGSLLT